MDRKNGWRERWLKLVQNIERLDLPGDRFSLLVRLSNPDKPSILAFVNAHAMNLIVNSDSFFESICAADTVLRDGSGMETLFYQLNIQPGLNLNGTDLIPDVINQFNGRCIALFGTRNPYLANGAKFISNNLAPQSKYIMADGFLECNAYISMACEYHPALIVLGMGMPQQEKLAIALRSNLDFPCLIVCGGAIIDFFGGKTERAPLWIRRAGMEWLYRLRMEPRRLFKRYVIGNLVFLMRVIILSVVFQRLKENVVRKFVQDSCSK